MVSMIMVSDMELGGGHGHGGATGGAVLRGGGTPQPHLSPGMSSRLVIPVQLMSKVLGGYWGQIWGGWTQLCAAGGGDPAAGPGLGGTLTGRRMKNMVRAPTMGTSPRSGSRMTRSIPWSWTGGAALRCDPPRGHGPHPDSSPCPPSPACPSPPPCRRTSSPPRRSGRHPRSCEHGMWWWGGIPTMTPPPAWGGSGSCWGAPQLRPAAFGSPDVEVQQDLPLVGAGVSPDPQDTERLWGEQR